MKKINTDQMKKMELEMLEKLGGFCEKNGIEMFLGGGTLLGAVRHKGFIPWDDDVDVMMMRDDYEKLLELARYEKIGKNYKIISCDDNKNYYYAFAKMVDTRTCLDEDEHTAIEGMGVYIDVFPIDYAPKDLKKLFRKKSFYNKLNNLVNGEAKMAEPKNIFTKMAKFLLRPVGAVMSTNYPAKKINGLGDGVDEAEADKVLCISGRYDEIEVMPRDYISGSVKVEFEGKKYLAPVGYKDYLTKHYGKNYMKLLPKEKRTKQHEMDAYWREDE